MILGTGFDLIELARIAGALERHGERFLARCFTPGEIEFCRARRDMTPSLAARFAAKEAAAKALGTGIARGVGWLDIEVRRARGERPEMLLHGPANDRAAAMGVQRIHLSLTHARELAGAFVVLEGEVRNQIS